MANRDLLMSNNDIGSSRSNLYKSTPIPKKKKVIPNRVKRLVDNAVEAISEQDLNNEWNSILNANYIQQFLQDQAIDFQNELKAQNEQYIDYIKQYRQDHPFSLTWSDADIINFERNGQPIYDQSLYLTVPGSKGIIYPDSYKEYVPEATIDNPTNFRPNLSIPELARQYEYQYWLNNERPKELEELQQVGDIINGGISKIPLVNNWWWAPAFINAGLDNRYSRLTGQAYTPYTLPTIGNSVTATFMSPMSTYRQLTTQLGEQTGEYLGGDTGRFWGGMAGMAFPEFQRFGTNWAWPQLINYADNAGIFIPREGTWTRGIGRGTEGLEDLVRTGLVRGNPRGTEVTANNFAKLWRNNRGSFKTIMQETGIPDIENKYFSRTLTEKEFNAIKKVVQKHQSEQTTNKIGSINLGGDYEDPLDKYATYKDYMKSVESDIAHVESMPSRIASGEVTVNNEVRQTIKGPRATPIEERFGTNSDYVADGQPLAYYYPDGRNPFIKGHDYAGSNYAVRVNNPEHYGPFMHDMHLHPSFLRSPKLADPEVEVYKRLPFGLGWRLNKDRLVRKMNEDLQSKNFQLLK